VTPVSYFCAPEQTSPQFAFCFAKGAHGLLMPEDFRLDPPEDLFDGPVALFGSPPLWPVLRKAWDEGREWYYGDHAYMKRREFYRITRNAFQYQGRDFSTGERFRAFGREIQPWRRQGHHILVCPQSEAHGRNHGFDVHEWLRDVHATLAQHTGRPIVVRWKKQNGPHGRPIARDLANAWAVVVHSSAAAIDALIAGVPVFVLAPFACTARMGLSDLSKIDAPFYPDDREPFLHALADHQWTLREIFEGLAWRTLQEDMARAA
jgi:hypothetical protein